MLTESGQSNSVLLRAENISKRFADKLSVRALMNKPNEDCPAALEDVSLEIRSGEFVGIVGRNGSGKSTLLRILAGVTSPSEGSVAHSGRLASLIELAPGFDFQATGQDNARIAAALQGLGKEEIEQIMPEIEAFAELGDSFTKPLRTYSSGMVARVAFATIVHCRAQILLLDEVLAVGDEAFQRKCFARLEDMVAAGASVVFVSHSAQLVTQLCQRALLLQHGRIVMQGEPREVINHYYQSMSLTGIPASSSSDDQQLSGQGQSADHTAVTDKMDCSSYLPTLVSKPVSYESRGAQIDSVSLVNQRGVAVNQLVHGDVYKIVYQIHFTHAAMAVEPACLIKTASGVELGGMVAEDELTDVPAQANLQVELPFKCLLEPGTYFCNVGVRGVVEQEFDYLHRILDVLIFQVLEVKSRTFTGLVNLQADLLPSISKI